MAKEAKGEMQCKQGSYPQLWDHMGQNIQSNVAAGEIVRNVKNISSVFFFFFTGNMFIWKVFIFLQKRLNSILLKKKKMYNNFEDS